MFTIYVKSANGMTTAYTVNKSKTFKVLMAKIKYDLLKAYERNSMNEDRKDCDEIQWL